MANSILTLKYPSDINKSGSNGDYYENRRIIFMALPGEPTYSNQKKFYKSTRFSDLSSIQDQEIKAIITLPIPSSLQDSQSHSWSDESITGTLSDIANIALGDSKFGDWGASTRAKKIASGIGKMFKIATTGKDMMSYAVGKRTVMLKPGYFQNYKSSGLRSFSFTFDFVPENEDEANETRKIIGAFKILSSPSTYYGGGDNAAENDRNNEISMFSGFWDAFGVSAEHLMALGSMMSPFVWQIIVTNEKVNKMLQLKTCVCTNVNVTYGNDKFDCFADGMPKTMQLTLTFNEVQLQYAENYASSLKILENEFNTNPPDARDDINTAFKAGKMMYDDMRKGVGDLASDSTVETSNAVDEAKKAVADPAKPWYERASAAAAVVVGSAGNFGRFLHDIMTR